MTESQSKNKNLPCILLVDDDPLIIRMYQNRLSTDGYKVCTAQNGEEALAEVAKEKPALILLDVMMPQMNGVETLKVLKKEEHTRDIPVIILTNLGDREEDVQNAKKLGALEYLVKSEISLKELSQKVAEAVGSKQ